MATSNPKSRQWNLGDLALIAQDLDLSGDLTVNGTGTTIVSSVAYSTAAANVDGPLYVTASTEVALGNYANATNFKLDFGTAGSVTGLGGVVCAELDLGPGTTSGSYACFEAELNVPTSASTGTRTSFMSMNAWGANVAAFDTSGYLFDVGGLTAGASKLFRTGLTAATINAATTAALRIKIGATDYFIPIATATA